MRPFPCLDVSGNSIAVMAVIAVIVAMTVIECIAVNECIAAHSRAGIRTGPYVTNPPGDAHGGR
ncbi:MULTISPECIES: hypothetical protein [unclassified Streptomyces]|uniref:hypothetical protein n=1 Tax=unclassified Streptomyces TaxID=2593676 RepID=UPI003793C603